VADRDAAEAAYDAAQAKLNVARANMDQAQNPTAVQRDEAEAAMKKGHAEVAAAQATLAALKAGSSGGACSRQAPALPSGRPGERATAGNPGTYDPAACQAAIAAQETALISARETLSSAQGRHAQLVSGGAPTNQAQLDAAIEEAEANIRAAKAKLDAVGGSAEVQRPQLQGQLIAAQEKLRNSELRLNQLLSGLPDEEVAQAEAAVREAEQKLALAMVPSTENDMRAQRAQVEQARQQLEKAYLPSTAAEIEQQRQVVAQMEAQLQTKANPYTTVDLQTALAGVEQARANLAVAETNLAQTVVTAPFAGVVGQRLLNAGAFASNNAPIMVLVGNETEIHITVEEARVGALAPGQAVAFTMAAHPGAKFAGKVVGVAPIGDIRAHTFDVTILPNQQDSRLMPGMFAQVQVTAAENTEAVLVPRDAIVQVGGAPTVFVAEGGRAVARPVETGIVDEKTAEIVSGVEAGEPVITLGQNGLRNGQAVQAPTDRAEGGAGRGRGAGTQ
jgi:membrane fusion protein (multidrug efflux system)